MKVLEGFSRGSVRGSAAHARSPCLKEDGT